MQNYLIDPRQILAIEGEGTSSVDGWEKEVKGTALKIDKFFFKFYCDI
jgi:hypothetical protein